MPLFLSKVTGSPTVGSPFFPVSLMGVLRAADTDSLSFSSLTSRRDEYSICSRC